MNRYHTIGVLSALARASRPALAFGAGLIALLNGMPLAIAQSEPSCAEGIHDPSIDCGLPPPITNPDIINPESGLPYRLLPFSDPVFGATITRVTTIGEMVGNSDVMRNIYSKLQAWNADQTKVLMHVAQILHSDDYSVSSTGPSEGPPDLQWGLNPKWSPVEPDIIYSTWENELRRYDISDGTFQVVRTFPEYTELHKDSAWEEMSRDAPNEGHYTAMVGILPHNHTESFVFDVSAGIKSSVARAAGQGRAPARRHEAAG